MCVLTINLQMKNKRKKEGQNENTKQQCISHRKPKAKLDHTTPDTLREHFQPYYVIFLYTYIRLVQRLIYGFQNF